MSERIRSSYDDALYKSTYTLLYFYFTHTHTHTYTYDPLLHRATKLVGDADECKTNKNVRPTSSAVFSDAPSAA